jgi:hypothetical protein
MKGTSMKRGILFALALSLVAMGCAVQTAETEPGTAGEGDGAATTEIVNSAPLGASSTAPGETPHALAELSGKVPTKPGLRPVEPTTAGVCASCRANDLDPQPNPWVDGLSVGDTATPPR